LVRPAATAASPSTRASYGLPWPVVALPLRLPADSLTPGASRAQEARWPGWERGSGRHRSRRWSPGRRCGHPHRSHPTGRPLPETGRSRPRCGPPARRCRRWPGPRGRAWFGARRRGGRRSGHTRPPPPAPLGAQASPRQRGQDLGSRSPATRAASMARPGTRSCRWRPPSAWPGRPPAACSTRWVSAVRPTTSSVRSRARSRRRRIGDGGTKPGGGQQLPLGGLGAPHRAQPVGRGPARQVRDVTRVDPPDLQPCASSS
jgi:hypothetical protein